MGQQCNKNSWRNVHAPIASTHSPTRDRTFSTLYLVPARSQPSSPSHTHDASSAAPNTRTLLLATQHTSTLLIACIPALAPCLKIPKILAGVIEDHEDGKPQHMAWRLAVNSCTCSQESHLAPRFHQPMRIGLECHAQPDVSRPSDCSSQVGNGRRRAWRLSPLVICMHSRRVGGREAPAKGLEGRGQALQHRRRLLL